MMYMIYEEGEYRPYFLCDVCDSRITKENPGVYIYSLEPNKKKIVIITACKNKCHEKAKSFYGKGIITGWHDIKILLKHIGNNTLNF